MNAKSLLLSLAGILFAAAPISAELVTNGDFEVGDLTGWTFTADLNSEPRMVAGVASFGGSNVFRVNPGNSSGGRRDEMGGTLTQSVILSNGVTYDLSASLIAIREVNGNGNIDGGTVTVTLGGDLLHTFDVEGIAGSTTVFDSFSTQYASTIDGSAPLAIRFTRGYRNFSPVIYHYFDNISLIPVPEPTSAAIVGCGFISLFVRRYRLDLSADFCAEISASE